MEQGGKIEEIKLCLFNRIEIGTVFFFYLHCCPGLDFRHSQPS